MLCTWRFGRAGCSGERLSRTGFHGAQFSRGKANLAKYPPWRRWPKDGIQRLKRWRLPEVEPAFDILSCEEPGLVAGAISEVVPWKRRWEHHVWLHEVCSHLRTLLPQMEPADVMRVILAFGELYTKRKRHTLLFHDFETYTQLFQALPVEVATEKSLLPLMRCYRRMGVSHEPFVRAICDRVVEGEVELSPGQLSELVQIHGELKLRSPRLFDFAAEALDLRFPYFSEDQVGDLARTFRTLQYHCPLFLAVLRRELPYRLHEYAWWNLIDIGEMYVVLQVQEKDIAERIANEVYKLILNMKYSYPAKALKILAFLEVGDKRTLRLLVRNVPRSISYLSPQAAAETIVSCVSLDIQPEDVFHRLKAWRLYLVLLKKLMPELGSLTPKMTCDVVAAIAKAGQKEFQFAVHVEAAVDQRPFKFHAEHLISMLRDFATLQQPCAKMRRLLLNREHELPECTPSALCALPAALAGHQTGPDEDQVEERMLERISDLLCKPGVYKLPTDGRVFRSKDDFWWEQMRQRHFRLRRRAKERGSAVPTAEEEEPLEGPPAVVHVSREECVQLVVGCAKLDFRHEALLKGVTSWLCEGRRHAELSAEEVAAFLDSFAQLGYAQPLLRAALEHALLRVAPEMPPESCTRALQGAIDVGMSVRGTAVRSLLRRCGSRLKQLPEEDAEKLRHLAASVLHQAESEVLATASLTKLGDQAQRLPLDLQLFRKAVTDQLGFG